MKNFKPNQKVVYKPFYRNGQDGTHEPPIGCILTIKEKYIGCYWVVVEYEYNALSRQAFHENCLFPTEEVFSEQSQEDIERIESEIEQEQLITVTP